MKPGFGGGSRAVSGLYGDDRDTVEVAYPASGALFLSGKDFEGAVGIDRLAVFGVSDDNLAGVDGGVDFREGVEDFVAVSAFGDDAGHEEMAANFLSLRYSEFGEESDERDSGVGFAGPGMGVVDGNGGVRQRRELGRGEGKGVVLICDGETGGADGRSVRMHLPGERGSGENAGEGRGKESAHERAGHKTHKFDRMQSLFIYDFDHTHSFHRRQRPVQWTDLCGVL